jgi:hypothetical protein
LSSTILSIFLVFTKTRWSFDFDICETVILEKLSWARRRRQLQTAPLSAAHGGCSA